MMKNVNTHIGKGLRNKWGLVWAALDYSAIGFIALFCSILRVLPRCLANRLALGLIKSIFIFVPRFRKVAFVNLHIVFPEKSNKELEAIYQGSLAVLADNIVGFARIPDFSLEKAASEFDFSAAKDCFESTIKDAEGKGVLLATAHFGNFELLIQAVAFFARPAAILARGFDLPRFNSWWIRRREQFGNEVFDRKGAYREIESRLKRGQDVAILCDQNVKRNHAIFVDLFGRKVATTKAVALAAIRTNAPIIFGVSCQKSPGSYEIYCTRINVPSNSTLSLEEKTVNIMEQIHRALEDVVRRYPDHWFWIHRRFKTRPLGEVEDTYR